MEGRGAARVVEAIPYNAYRPHSTLDGGRDKKTEVPIVHAFQAPLQNLDLYVTKTLPLSYHSINGIIRIVNGIN